MPTARFIPPTPIRACIIDLDGTMVDTIGDFEIALNAMLTQLGRTAVSRIQISRWVGKGSEHLIETALQNTLPLGAGAQAPVAQLMPDAWQHYQEAYLRINGQHSALFPGVPEGLAALKEQGMSLACLTNKPLSFAVPLLQAKGIFAYFSHVFGGDSFARKKPDPLPLIETCKALGCDPSATLMVGDSANDAQAARAAGCPVVLVTYGYNHGEAVQSVDADGYFDSLAELGPWLKPRQAKAR